MAKQTDLRQTETGSDIAMVSMGCGGDSFEFKAELIGKIISEKGAEVDVGRNPFPLDLTFYRAVYTVTCVCTDDQLTVLDDDLEKYDLGTVKSGALKLPASFTEDQRKSVFDQDFFDKVTASFKVDAEKHAEPTGTCGKVRLALTLDVPPFKAPQLPRKGGGGFAVEVKDKDYKVRVKSAFRVCCCTFSATEEEGTKCSFSSKCLYFETEKIQGAITLSGLELKWQLNATVGGCGKVAFKEKVTGYF